MPRPDVVLDWRPQPPARRALNEPFRLEARPACGSLAARKSILRTKGVWLDQGSEGACTGFGAEHVMALTPYSVRTSGDVARGVYYGARRWDEWPGEDYEGSSVNGAMHAERELKRIDEWYWARTVNEACHGVSYHGAGELGVDWYDGMWGVDGEGMIHATGERVGGHALAYAGYKPHPLYVRLHRLENSWGQDWGDNGGAWISEADFVMLLNNSGELAFPKKRRV